MNKKNIIGILLLINIIILYDYYIIIDKYNTCIKKVRKINTEFYENNLKKSLYNPIEHLYNKIIYTYPSDTSKYPFTLIAEFEEKGCPTCIKKEIKELNIFYKVYPRKLKVFHFGQDKKFLKQYGAKFKYTIIDTSALLFTKKLNYNKPLVLLIGPDNTIYNIHKAEKGVSVKTRIFYNRIMNLFQYIYK